MTADVVLRPGRVSLAEWRAVYRGARVTLDWVSRADVEAGAAALQAIVAAEHSNPNVVAVVDAAVAEPPATAEPPLDGAAAEPAPAPSRRLSEGEALPASVARLLLALKLASLAQGASGAGWALVKHLADCLALGMVPVVRCNGDLTHAMLDDFAAALAGTGEMACDGEVRPAVEALEAAGLTPPTLAAREAAALASGTQIATALSLAGLFEAESILQSTLVTGAMCGEAVRAPENVLHPALQRLNRHGGSIECAAALRALLTRSKPRPPEAVAAWTAGDTVGLDLQAQVTGACLDVLRRAGDVLSAEANAVSETLIVVWQTGEAFAHRPSGAVAVALAADMIAVALAHLGFLSERRIATLSVAPPLRQSRASPAGDGLAGMSSTATAFAAENRQKAQPTSLPADPEMAEAAVPASGARRLLQIAGNVTLILAIELIAASEALDLAGRKSASDALEPVRELLRARIPKRGKDTLVAPHLAMAADLIRSGAVVSAAGLSLPSIVLIAPDKAARRLGARGNRP